MVDRKNLDWKTYESITKYIYESLGEKSGVKVKGYGQNCKVAGKSGVSHQIDVLTTHTDGIHSYDTAIECKYWKEKVSKDIVMKVSEIIADANIHKGVIVSKNGFTPDAVEYARYRDIGLVELREADDEDLEGIPREMHIADIDIRLNILITRPQILQIIIGDNQQLEIEDEFDYYDYLVKFEDGSQNPLMKYISDLRAGVEKMDDRTKEITRIYKTPKAVVYNRTTDTAINTDEISITGQLVEIDASRTIGMTLVDKVWLIMKSIFEERVFSFTEGGVIVETKK